jgi:hypothetical protein
MPEEEYDGGGPTEHEDKDDSPNEVEDENLQNGHDPDFAVDEQNREEDNVAGPDDYQEDVNDEFKEDDEEVNED